MADEFNLGGDFDDPNGISCIERICQGCGDPFLVNLYLQARISDESPLSRCDDCIRVMIAAGKKQVLKLCGPYERRN